MDLIEKLQNIFSHRQIDSYEIVDSCDNEGKIVLQLPFQAEYKEDATYYVSLLELSTTSFFPNVDESNNQFYYSGPDNDIKTIEIPTGAYDVTQYGNYIKSFLTQVNNIYPIDISLSETSGKVIIKLAENYKVYFNREKTWAHELGFDEEMIDQKINISQKVADVLKVQKVYLSCDIVKGCYFNGRQTNILFSFPNSKRFGFPLSFLPQKQQYRLLNKKCFNKITFTFTDDKNNPVDFMKAKVTLLLQIKQL